MRDGSSEYGDSAERRGADRRAAGRGGRRRRDRGVPWWRGGLWFAALCALLRCWRWFRPSTGNR